MDDQLTPKQVARAIGVSEASLKRWCDKGLIQTVRTAGGHRRLSLCSVLAFIRTSGHQLAHPDVLGLPVTSGCGNAVVERSRSHFCDALLAGNGERVRHIAFDLYLAGRSLVEICDSVIATAMHTIGSQWEHGRAEVFQERRAVEIAYRLVAEFLRLLPPPADNAPFALGATLEGDPYTLATLMVELAFREAGWRADSLGVGLPAEALEKAIARDAPRVFWISVSAVPDRARFLSNNARLFNSVREAAGVMVLGGRALRDDLRRELQYHMFCDNLRHLVAFAETIYLAPTRVPTSAGQ